MASQLYSRYVPGKSQVIEASSTDQTAQNIHSANNVVLQSLPTTKTDASSTYTRYIPSVAKAKATVPAQTQSGTEHHRTNIVASPISKRKHTEAVDGAGGAQPAKRSKKDSKKISNTTASEDITEPTSVKHASAVEEDNRHKALLDKREKSIRKAEKLARKLAEAAAEDADEEGEAIEEQPIVYHPLEPLPQPEPAPEPIAQSTYDALPSWISQPIRIHADATAEFIDLGLTKDAIENLREKGFEKAFAVQAAALPFLLPVSVDRYSDVLVSAATGSGKTLAYVLPMAKDLSTTTVPALRGVIVMPTRELVNQARQVAEICANAFAGHDNRRINIGIAVGNQTIQSEQSALIHAEQCYDPEAYNQVLAKANSKWETASQESDDSNEFVQYEEDDAQKCLPGHILRHSPKIDILICTPGRLVEHLKSTPGFNLEHLRWLVIDEADKLLDQSFQQWRETVMKSLPLDDSNVTKVVLSATMTRDVGLLAGLKLRRPKLIVLEGAENGDDHTGQVAIAGDALNLPENLTESAVKVEDDGDKPLYLQRLLKDIMSTTSAHSVEQEDHSSDSDEDSVSSSSSSPSSSSSSSSSENASLSENDSESNSTPSSSAVTPVSKSRKAKSSAVAPGVKGVLIFTKSNENAVRLSRLLALMSPEWASAIGTLTSTVRNSYRKKTLRGFSSGTVSIIIASDLVSRGLDLPDLAHVINYDLPTSLTSYVHRVGRTARAGKQGSAWTLFTKTEGRWFWHELARNPLVKRSGEKMVARYNIDKKSFGESEREHYEVALETLGKEAAAKSREQ